MRFHVGLEHFYHKKYVFKSFAEISDKQKVLVETQMDEHKVGLFW
jgi:hypothetical protein